MSQRVGQPDVLGDYRVVEEVAKGAQGTIYRVVHRSTEEVVALKSFDVPTPQALHLFRRELSLLKRLSHPGLVRLLDFGGEGNRRWYTMPLLQGMSLQDYLAEQGAARSTEEVKERVRLLYELCDVLSYIHSEGVVHGDLKPENVFVLSSMRPVLLDFGLATMWATSNPEDEFLDSTEGVLVGTPFYMSPEQQSGQVDPRSDLYSFGCILYECMLGQTPFDAESLLGVLEAHRDSPAPLLPEGALFSPELQRLCSQLLEKNPRRRSTYAIDVCAQMSKVLEPEESDSLSSLAERPLKSGYYLYRSCMVGRQDEFLQGRRFVREVGAHQSRCLFLAGESGVGKTRLAKELLREARRAGLQVIKSRCKLRRSLDEKDRGREIPPDALAAFRPALQWTVEACLSAPTAKDEQLLEQVRPWLAYVAPYVPELQEWLPGVAALSLAKLPPQAARKRLFVALGKILSCLAQHTSYLLFLDDLQWLDELSLGFFLFLWKQPAPFVRGIHVLGTFRTEECSEALQELLNSTHVETLSLAPLSDAETHAMVGELLSTEEPPVTLMESLVEQGEGNPFFIAEYLRVALDEGILLRHWKSGWSLSLPKDFDGELELPLPGSLRDLVVQRFHSFSPNTQFVAGAIALAGSLGELLDWDALIPLGEDNYFESLESLLQSRVLEENEPELFTFSHHQMEEYAQELLEEAQRKELHQSIATQLEELNLKDLLSFQSSLGHHWSRAGFVEKGRSHYLKAARHARSQYAYLESAELYGALLDLYDEVNQEEINIRLEVGREVHYLTGQYEQALFQFQTALRESSRLGLTQEVGRSHYQMACIHAKRGQMQEGMAACEEARKHHHEAGDLEGDGETLNLYGVLHCIEGKLEQGLALYEQALALNQRCNHLRNQAVSLGNMGIVYKSLRSFGKAEEAYRKAIEVTQRSNLRRDEGINLGNLAGVYTVMERWDEALALSTEAVQILREVGDLSQEGIYLCSELHIKRLMNHPHEELVALGLRAERLLREVYDPLYLAYALCEKGHLELLWEEGESARTLLNEACEIANTVGVKVGAPNDCGQSLWRLSSALQDYDDGKALFRGEAVGSLTPEIRSYFIKEGVLDLEEAEAPSFHG